MSTSLALGGPNITGGVLQPRFPQKPDAFDVATGLLGAGLVLRLILVEGFMILQLAILVKVQRDYS